MLTDVRQAWRSLIGSPTVALTATLTIGANAAIFRIADGVLFKPPYGDPDRLFIVQSTVRMPRLMVY